MALQHPRWAWLGMAAGCFHKSRLAEVGAELLRRSHHGPSPQAAPEGSLLAVLASLGLLRVASRKAQIKSVDNDPGSCPDPKANTSFYKMSWGMGAGQG